MGGVDSTELSFVKRLWIDSFNFQASKDDHLISIHGSDGKVIVAIAIHIHGIGDADAKASKVSVPPQDPGGQLLGLFCNEALETMKDFLDILDEPEKRNEELPR